MSSPDNGHQTFFTFTNKTLINNTFIFDLEPHGGDTKMADTTNNKHAEYRGLQSAQRRRQTQQES